jgi:hypothetical protein
MNLRYLENPVIPEILEVPYLLEHLYHLSLRLNLRYLETPAIPAIPGLLERHQYPGYQGHHPYLQNLGNLVIPEHHLNNYYKHN